MVDSYRNLVDFEKLERRRSGTFQMCIDDLAKDLYIDLPVASDDDETRELDFGR